jgi:hypothetical protein
MITGIVLSDSGFVEAVLLDDVDEQLDLIDAARLVQLGRFQLGIDAEPGLALDEIDHLLNVSSR